uniref:Uncharacterized protein n=1 Tax=Anguilla anguilla TaxID=7936 RepID=A0A0E9RXE0_ANGAN
MSSVTCLKFQPAFNRAHILKPVWNLLFLTTH